MSDDAMEVDSPIRLWTREAAPAAVAAPAPAPLLGSAPAAVAAADAAGPQQQAGSPQQQALPANSAEAAAAVRQRLDDFEQTFTVAMVAIMTARDMHLTPMGNIFEPKEHEGHKKSMSEIEESVTMYANSVRAHGFGFASTMAGLVLDETAELLVHFQQKLQLTLIPNADDLHADVRLRCVITYLQHIHAAFQPAELPVRQQRLRDAVEHQKVIKQAAAPVSQSISKPETVYAYSSRA
jgi:hypothetical protein